VVTKKGERTQFHLKDGTQVKLNAASKLRIPDNYGKAGRKVYLQGEAFFKVVHNEKKPFKVISGGIVAKDVGTAFDVANYDSSNIKIAVKEGAVSVGKVMKHNGKPLQVMGELRKNDLGVFDSAGKFSVSAISGESPYWGWTEGKLIFRDAPFPEVVKRLERWFNIDGKIKGAALRKRTLTAAYDDLSLKSVLNVLSYSLHISCARQGDTIVFKEKALSQE
jgi:ferric-dicitrate binding protein FerR (iron transport regulator)